MFALLELRKISTYRCWAQSAALVFACSAVFTVATAQEIKVGQVGPFTVLPSPDAHDINKGAQAYFNDINANGGLRGRKISFSNWTINSTVMNLPSKLRWRRSKNP